MEFKLLVKGRIFNVEILVRGIFFSIIHIMKKVMVEKSFVDCSRSRSLRTTLTNLSRSKTNFLSTSENILVL